MTKRLFKNQGTSLLEAIVAIAVFIMLAASLTVLALGGFDGLRRGREHDKATMLSSQALEAARGIAARDWSALIYAASGLNENSGIWSLKGEGTIDQIGDFERQLVFAPVCRDSATAAVTVCPDGIVDDNSKRLTVKINWPNPTGRTELEFEYLLINHNGEVGSMLACAVPPDKLNFTRTVFNRLYDINGDGKFKGTELDVLCVGGPAGSCALNSGIWPQRWEWDCGQAACSAYLLDDYTMPTSTLELAPTTEYLAGGRHLARDTKERVYVVFLNQSRLYYRVSLDSGYTWEAPALVSSDIDVTGAAIGIDAADRVHFVWTGRADTSTPRLLRYSELYQGVMTNPVSIYSSRAIGDQSQPSMAIDSTGRAQVVWIGANTGSPVYKQVQYVRVSSPGIQGQWKNLTSGSFDNEAPAVAVDQSNHVHAVWSGKAQSSPQFKQIFHQEFTHTNTITATRNLSQASSDQTAPSVATDETGNPQIVWSGRVASEANPQIRYVYRVNGNIWRNIINITNDSAYAQNAPSVVVDDDGSDINVFWTAASANHPDYQTIRQRYLFSAGVPATDTGIKADSVALMWGKFNLRNQLPRGFAYLYYRNNAMQFYATQ